MKARLATQNLEDKIIGYQDWAEQVLGKEYRDYFSDEYVRRAARAFAIFLDNVNENSDNIAEIQDLLEEMKVERIKTQTANLEYNAIQRAEARNAMFNEQLIEAINRLDPIKPHERIKWTKSENTGTTALLAISDLHAGSMFIIHGLHNEVVNEYSYDIMCKRLWSVIDKIEDDDLVFDDMTVAICGDLFENILRESSLVKLREPVIDTVIKFSEFLSNWMLELSTRLNTRVNVVTVGGNHDIIRSLSSRPMFEGENLTKVVVEFMKLRLANCEWITVDDYQDVAIKTIKGTNIMFQHGEDKELKTTLDYFSNLYNIDIDEIIAGHKHTPESKGVGITDVGDRLLTRVGSIVGIDTFAKKIRVSTRPSCYVAMYTYDQGKTWSRNYYL